METRAQPFGRTRQLPLSTHANRCDLLIFFTFRQGRSYTPITFLEKSQEPTAISAMPRAKLGILSSVACTVRFEAFAQILIAGVAISMKLLSKQPFSNMLDKVAKTAANLTGSARSPAAAKDGKQPAAEKRAPKAREAVSNATKTAQKTVSAAQESVKKDLEKVRSAVDKVKNQAKAEVEKLRADSHKVTSKTRKRVKDAEDQVKKLGDDAKKTAQKVTAEVKSEAQKLQTQTRAQVKKLQADAKKTAQDTATKVKAGVKAETEKVQARVKQAETQVKKIQSSAKKTARKMEKRAAEMAAAVQAITPTPLSRAFLATSRGRKLAAERAAEAEAQNAGNA